MLRPLNGIQEKLNKIPMPKCKPPKVEVKEDILAVKPVQCEYCKSRVLTSIKTINDKHVCVDCARGKFLTY